MTSTPSSPEHFDVLIVGAGISGIGAAYHLQQQCPDQSFVLLETQAEFGGTWRTHQYPGIRSDSDLFTFGYRFKPWEGAPIATGEEILSYMNEVIEENQIDPHIRYKHTITNANWSNTDKLWTVTAQIQGAANEAPTIKHFTASFLWMCQGYYRHDQGYTPEWPGMDEYQGSLIHPQTWPDDADLSNKQVVVIGSGATAATLVPNIANDCAHVTMLQRSPTYFITGRNANELADTLRELDVPPEWTHEIVRRKILLDQTRFAERCLSQPDAVTKELLAGVGAALGPGSEEQVKQNLTPTYRPWRQRVAFVPDADLFKSISSGKASITTDEIERFTANGIQLKSGKHLPADVVISATGFNLNVMGDIPFSIDGKPLNWADTVTYRGAMFTGVPNLVWVFGYFRASWTLRVDLIGDFVCRLLNERKTKNASVVTPTLRPQDQSMTLQPWVDPENFNPGYLTRGMHLLPKQGDHSPWLHAQDYWADKDELPVADLNDGTLVYL